MAEEKAKVGEERVKCGPEFEDFVRKTTEWIERQREMLETKPTPEQVEEITKLYQEMMEKAKKFSTCEVGR